MAMFNVDIPELMQPKQVAEPSKLRSKLVYKDGKVSADIYADEVDKLPQAFQPFLSGAASNVSESQNLESEMNAMRRDRLKQEFMKASDVTAKAEIEAAKQAAAGNVKFGPDWNPFAQTYQQKAEEKRRQSEALKRDLELTYNMSTGQTNVPQATITQPEAQPQAQPQVQVQPQAKSYASESEARSAGAKTGDIITLQGVGKVRLK